MSSYKNLFNGSYNLQKENMKLHLTQENEQKLNVIDNSHLNFSNERNRNNNSHTENLQRLSNERNRNNNSLKENMKRLKNERENNEKKRNIEKKLNEQRYMENITIINNRHEERKRELDNIRHKKYFNHTENMDRLNKEFQLNMNLQNNNHQQAMDKLNKDFQLAMNLQNQKYIENLKRIENEGLLIQLKSNIKMQQLQMES